MEKTLMDEIIAWTSIIILIGFFGGIIKNSIK